MTLFDYLVLFILVCSVAIGMLRGLIKEVLSLLGWIVALVVANAYGDALAALLPDAIPGHVTRLIIAFVALFIGVRLLTMLLAVLLDSFIEATGLTMADRGLGAIFGFARGVVIVLAAVLVCGMTDIPRQEFWKKATLSPLAVSMAQTVLPLLPDNVAKYIRF